MSANECLGWRADDCRAPYATISWIFLMTILDVMFPRTPWKLWSDIITSMSPLISANFSWCDTPPHLGVVWGRHWYHLQTNDTNFQETTNWWVTAPAAPTNATAAGASQSGTGFLIFIINFVTCCGRAAIVSLLWQGIPSTGASNTGFIIWILNRCNLIYISDQEFKVMHHVVY